MTSFDPTFFGLFLVTILSLIDFVSEFHAKHKAYFPSFSAGVSASYIFIHLMPSLYGALITLPRYWHGFVLLGFVGYHLAQKYIYLHEKGAKITQSIRVQQTTSLFLTHLFLGIIIVDFVEAHQTSIFLLFIPAAVHLLVDEFPNHFSNIGIRFLLCAAPLWGGLLAALVSFPFVVDLALLGVIAGMMLFVEARELHPYGHRGSPLAFILGVLFYLPLIVI